MGVGQRRGGRGRARAGRRNRHHGHHHHGRNRHLGLRFNTGGGTVRYGRTPSRYILSGIVSIIFGCILVLSVIWIAFIFSGSNIVAMVSCPVVGIVMIAFGILNIVRACHMQNQLANPQENSSAENNTTVVNMGSQAQVQQQGAVWTTGQSGAAVAYGAGGQLGPGYPIEQQGNMGQIGYPAEPQSNMGYPAASQSNVGQMGYPAGPQSNMGYPAGPQSNMGQMGYPAGPQSTTEQMGYPAGPQSNVGQMGYPSGLQPGGSQPQFVQVQPPTDQMYTQGQDSSNQPPPSYDDVVKFGAGPSEK